MFIDFAKHSWGSGGLMGSFLLHSPIPIAGQEEYYQQKPKSAPCCIMNFIILTYGAPTPPPPPPLYYIPSATAAVNRTAQRSQFMFVFQIQHQLHYQKIQQYDVDHIQVGMKNMYVTQHGSSHNGSLIS